MAVLLHVLGWSYRATERIIELTFTILSNTMRGFKSRAKTLAHPYIESFLRGEDRAYYLNNVIEQPPNPDRPGEDHTILWTVASAARPCPPRSIEWSNSRTDTRP